MIHEKFQAVSSGSICQSQWRYSGLLHLPSKFFKNLFIFTKSMKQRKGSTKYFRIEENISEISISSGCISVSKILFRPDEVSLDISLISSGCYKGD